MIKHPNTKTFFKGTDHIQHCFSVLLYFISFVNKSDQKLLYTIHGNVMIRISISIDHPFFHIYFHFLKFQSSVFLQECLIAFFWKQHLILQ